MKIEVIRSEFTDRTTIGRVVVDGKFEGYSLEDACREDPPGSWHSELKIPHKTAIPYGTYEVTITFSKRFNRPLPLLLGVPNFEGIRIHNGNTESDTHGCILVGKTKGKDFIGESLIACSSLYIDIRRALDSEKVFISIVKETA